MLPKNMKKNKQNKIKTTEPQSFLKGAQSAALEAAHRVANKLNVPGISVLLDDQLSQVADNAVSVYQRLETVNKRYGQAGQKQNQMVIDVLVNPAHVPARLTAQAIYEDRLPIVEDAKRRSPTVQLVYWDSLVEKVKDYKAISCVFRVTVLLDDNNVAERLTACSYKRQDSIGKLNAVRYGSEKLSDVEKLLVLQMGIPGADKRDWSTISYESWAGQDPADRWKDINIERIVESAVDQCEPYRCLSQETLKDYVDKLTDSKLYEYAQQAQERNAEQVYVANLAVDIEKLGFKVVSGPSSHGPDYSTIYSVGVVDQSVVVSNEDRPGVYKLVQARKSLEALHKALVK